MSAALPGDHNRAASTLTSSNSIRKPPVAGMNGSASGANGHASTSTREKHEVAPAYTGPTSAAHAPNGDVKAVDYGGSKPAAASSNQPQASTSAAASSNRASMEDKRNSTVVESPRSMSGTEGMNDLGRSGTGGTAAGGSMTSLSKKQIKVEEQAEKRMEKVLASEEKGDNKRVKSAMKSAGRADKVEQKAAKMQAKAKKAVDNAVKKEYKTNKTLTKATTAHDKAAVDLEQAKKTLELKTSHHMDVANERDNSLTYVDNIKKEKAAYDADRANRRASVLGSGSIGSSTR